jgi:hypothetical protein
VSGGFGLTGGGIYGLEAVVNYDSGQISLFAFGGGQVGWNGIFSASAYSGFAYGLNRSNTNYSKGFTGFNASGQTLGGFAAFSNDGLAGGLRGLMPNRKVRVGGLSLGRSATGFTIGMTGTYYSPPLQVGKHWAFTLSPLDGLLYSMRQVCN